MTNDQLIVSREAEILRRIAKPVKAEEFGTKEFDDLIAVMKKALRQEDDGVAIAAPQVGRSLRIFVVRGGVLKRYPEDTVFVNPVIVKHGRKTRVVEEGCLSLRWLYGNVLRYERVTLKALDESGTPVTVGASGLLAQIFQHEIDHLDGVLFIDKASDIRDLPPGKEA